MMDLRRSISLRSRPTGLQLLIWVFLTSFIGCQSPQISPERLLASDARQEIGTQAQCTPRFPDHAGWLGGDAAYSIPLGAGSPEGDPSKSIWLFGDSFVAPRSAAPIRHYPFLHNTLGLSRCDRNGRWSLETFWRQAAAESKSAFFEPDPDASWVRNARDVAGTAPYYWPFDGFVAHGSLFIGLLRIVPSEPRGPLNMPFRVAGMDLARIDNPTDPPERWRIQKSTFSRDTHAIPGSTFVLHDEFVYAFVFFDGDDGRSPRALSRIPLRSLAVWKEDISGDFETFDQASRWIPGFRPGSARILMHDDATEMSVHFDPSLGRWLSVYATPSPASRDDEPSFVRLRSAERIEGPWSSPQNLFAIPETLRPQAGPPDENLFCYAAKAHPQFAMPGSLLVTYVCNLYARTDEEVLPILERLRKSPTLYRPRAIRIPIPELAGADAKESEPRAPNEGKSACGDGGRVALSGQAR